MLSSMDRLSFVSSMPFGRMAAQKGVLSALIGLGVLGTGCAQTPYRGPLMDAPFRAPDATLVWHGTGEVERLVDGTWVRFPPLDYELTVVQRRYGAVWESTKEMRRRHPDYDGSAGPRTQSHHFTVRYDAEKDGVRPFAIASTFGDGTGTMSASMRDATMRFAARGGSSFAPFDTYQIDQTYRYADGRLDETVWLLKTADGTDAPWARAKERTVLFAPAHFDVPPGAPRTAR